MPLGFRFIFTPMETRRNNVVAAALAALADLRSSPGRGEQLRSKSFEGGFMHMPGIPSSSPLSAGANASVASDDMEHVLVSMPWLWRKLAERPTQYIVVGAATAQEHSTPSWTPSWALTWSPSWVYSGPPVLPPVIPSVAAPLAAPASRSRSASETEDGPA